MYEGFYISDAITDAALAGTAEANELEKLLTAVNNRTVGKYEKSGGIVYKFKEGLRIRVEFIATALSVGAEPVVINPDALDMSTGVPRKVVQCSPIKLWMSFAGSNLSTFEDMYNTAPEKAVDSENDIYYFYAEPVVDPKLKMSRKSPDILTPITGESDPAVVDSGDPGVPPAEDPADIPV